MRKYRMKKGWWLLHFGRMLGPKILLNVYIPPRSLTVCITSCLYFITPVFKNLKAGLALFLEHDPSEWDNLEQYKRNQDTCHSVFFSFRLELIPRQAGSQPLGFSASTCLFSRCPVECADLVDPGVVRAGIVYVEFGSI